MVRLVAFCRRFWPLLTGIGLAVITALSLSPMPELPMQDTVGNDKLHHFLAYAGLAIPVTLARPRYRWLAIPAFVAWSGALELLQPFVGRHGEWIDLAANGSGILLGVAAASALRRAAEAA